MKTASNDLFLLINALTRHEKAYFKRYCGLYNDKEQHYVRLFDLISNQEVYDETILKKQLKNDKLKGYLSRAKKYLYNKILESMRNYHAERDLLQELRQQIQEIDFLIKKDLLQQAQKKLKKAYQKATQAKLASIRFDLWRMQFLLWSKNNYSRIGQEQLEGLKEEMMTCLEEEKSVLQHRFLQASLRSAILQKGDYSKYAFQEFLTNYQEKALEMEPLGVEAEFYHAFGQAHYLRVNQGLQESLSNYIKATQVLAKFPDLKCQLFDFYLTSITHLIGVALNCFDVAVAEKGLEELQSILSQEKKQLSEAERIKYRAYYYFLKVKYHYDCVLYPNEKTAIIESTQKALAADWEKVDLQVRLVILLCFIYLSLAKADYEGMQAWCNQLLSLAEQHFRTDIQSEVQTWLIVANFELGNYELVAYQIRNLMRQKEEKYLVNQIICTTIKACINSANQQRHWAKMVMDLEAFATAEQNYPPIIIYTYALSKSKRQPFAQIHRQTFEAKRDFLSKG